MNTEFERVAAGCVDVRIPNQIIHQSDDNKFSVVHLTLYDALNWSDSLYVEASVHFNTPKTIEAEIGQEWA